MATPSSFAAASATAAQSSPATSTVDVAAHRLRRGHRLGGGVVQVRVVVLGEDQDGHQITPASVFSFAISSSTEPTLTPALRVAGSTVFTTFSRGVTSTP